MGIISNDSSALSLQGLLFYSAQVTHGNTDVKGGFKDGLPILSFLESSTDAKLQLQK